MGPVQRTLSDERCWTQGNVSLAQQGGFFPRARSPLPAPLVFPSPASTSGPVGLLPWLQRRMTATGASCWSCGPVIAVCVCLGLPSVHPPSFLPTPSLHFRVGPLRRQCPCAAEPSMGTQGPGTSCEYRCGTGASLVFEVCGAVSGRGVRLPVCGVGETQRTFTIVTNFHFSGGCLKPLPPPPHPHRPPPPTAPPPAFALPAPTVCPSCASLCCL